LVEPSYISLYSALLYHKLIQQVPVNIQFVTTVNPIVMQSVGLEYHKISPKLYFGYDKIKIENSYILIAKPEKALIDGLY